MKSRVVTPLARLSRRKLLQTAAGFGGVATLGLCPDLAAAGTLGRTTPYRLEDFFTPQRTRGVTLSPGGTLLAVLEQLGTEEEPHGIIDILNAE